MDDCFGRVGRRFVGFCSTGRLLVQYFVIDTDAVADLKALASGCYVSLLGDIRSPPKPYFAATCMRLVPGTDEMSYHMIEAVHAALTLRQGPAIEAAAAGLAAMEDVVPAKALADLVPALASLGVATKGSLEGSALRQAVLDPWAAR